MNNIDNIHLIDDLLPESEREGMRTRSGNRIKADFLREALAWDSAVKYFSNPMHIMENSHVKALMAMGPTILPLALAWVKEKRDLKWCWLLEQISGKCLSTFKCDGLFIKWDVEENVQACLKWGESHFGFKKMTDIDFNLLFDMLHSS